MTYSWLPAMLAELVEVVGLETTLAFAEHAGGRRVTIPARAKDDHWLVQAVGRTEADRICEHFRTLDAEGREAGARQIVVPLGPERGLNGLRRRMAKCLADGMTAREAAAATGMHERTAFYAKAKMGGRGRGKLAQPTLFETLSEPASKPARKPVRR